MDVGPHAERCAQAIVPVNNLAPVRPPMQRRQQGETLPTFTQMTRPGVDQGGPKAAASGKTVLVRPKLKYRRLRLALSSGLQRPLLSCHEWLLPTAPPPPDFRSDSFSNSHGLDQYEPNHS